jgi:hypothetical protein
MCLAWKKPCQLASRVQKCPTFPYCWVLRTLTESQIYSSDIIISNLSFWWSNEPIPQLIIEKPYDIDVEKPYDIESLLADTRPILNKKTPFSFNQYNYLLFSRIRISRAMLRVPSFLSEFISKTEFILQIFIKHIQIEHLNFFLFYTVKVLLLYRYQHWY